MNNFEDLIKAISDFSKGKCSYPSSALALLRSEGEIDFDALELPEANQDFASLSAEYRSIVAALKRCDRDSVVSILSGMLLLPELQANVVRLEVLVQLAIAHCKGTARPTPAQVAAWFNQMDDGSCGLIEDPSETVFIQNIHGPFGNLRIVNGPDVDSGPSVQLFIEALGSIPPSHALVEMRRSVLALLEVSELVIGRAGLDRNILGAIAPNAQIAKPEPASLKEIASLTNVSVIDLASAGISARDLAPFVMPDDIGPDIMHAQRGDSPAEARPLIMTKAGLCLALPSTIGLAIRQFVVAFCGMNGFLSSLEANLMLAYSRLLRSESLIGGPSEPPVVLTKKEGFYGHSLVLPVDVGRYVHLVFVADTFDMVDETGFIGRNEPPALAQFVEDEISNAWSNFSSTPNFRGGLSLVVVCHWGRPFGLVLPQGTLDWQVHHISAHDLIALSRLPKFEPIFLFRMVEALTKAHEQGFDIFNTQGLLNLYGHMENNKWHIIPHEQMTSTEVPIELPMSINVPIHMGLGPRVEALRSTDIHVARTANEKWTLVRRLNGLPERGSTNLSPVYCETVSLGHGGMNVVIEGDGFDFWCEVHAPLTMAREMQFRMCNMAIGWAIKVAQAILKRPEFALSGCYRWLLKMDDQIDPNTDVPTELDVSRPLVAATTIDSRTSEIRLTASYLRESLRKENIAEKALARALACQAAQSLLPDLTEEGITGLCDAVGSDDGARHLHGFDQKDVRDFIRQSLPEAGQKIEPLDDATARLGLGWRARNRTDGPAISGKAVCCDYLRALVTSIGTKLTERLKTLNRVQTLTALLTNHETLAAEAEQWRRTYRAVSALSADPEGVTVEVSEHISHVNASSLACRVAAEACLCVSPLEGGLPPSLLDIADLMTWASQMFHFGGYSDAMNAGIMVPEIRISPGGDVLMNHSFTAEVLDPWGMQFQDIRLTHAAKTYDENYAAPEDDEERPRGPVTADFEEAWADEFGFSVDDVVKFTDVFFSMAAEQGEAICFYESEELLILIKDKSGLNEAIVSSILAQFTLTSRSEWTVVPDGMLPAAWFPWQFGRQLSLISRPIIRLSEAPDAGWMIVPAMIVHSLSHYLNETHSGALDQKLFRKGGKLSSYLGTLNGKNGEAFNEKIAEVILELGGANGWKARANLTNGEIIGEKKDPAFGDVDVLAWNQAQERVLAIECKDLTMDRTPGEIAKRLKKYQGLGEGRDRDELKRHLDRLNRLAARKNAVESFVGFEFDHIEGILLTSQRGPLQLFRTISDLGVRGISVSELLELLNNPTRAVGG